MILECPKCGFAQPNDKYCANCGVNMETYKPKPEPIFIKALNNIFVQLSIVVLLVGVTSLYLYQSQSKKFSDHIAGAQKITSTDAQEKTTQEVAQQAPSEAKDIGFAAETSDTQREKVNFRAPREETQPPVGSGIQTESEAGLFEDPTKTTPATTPKSIHYTIAEVSQEFLTTARAASTSRINFGEVEGIIIKHSGSAYRYVSDNDKTSKNKRSLQSTLGTTSQEVSLNTVYEYTPEGEGENPDAQPEELGLLVQFRSTLVGQEVSFSVDGQLRLKLADEADVTSSNFTGSSQLPSGHIAILSGALPHTPIAPDTEGLFSSSPLSILNSEGFRNNTSEFVILVHVQ